MEKGEAHKIQVVTAASADAEAKYLQGQGIARQRQAIVNGLRESVLSFSSDVSGAPCSHMPRLCAWQLDGIATSFSPQKIVHI